MKPMPFQKSLAVARMPIVAPICVSCLVAGGFLMVVPTTNSVGQDAPRNSTAKIRAQPSKQTSRIGSAVQWEPSFESAAKKSAETGKPIFWYVPTLAGTFMDRKPEINRYMMAGPFSWPDIISVINEHYIPVKAAPTRDQQKKFKLVAFKFVEPGFLILDADGSSTMSVDRITTMHPDWFRGLLTRDLLQPIPRASKPPVLAEAWEFFRSRKYAETIEHLTPSKFVDFSDAQKCEGLILRGMAHFRTGDQTEAIQIWNNANRKFPNEPLAWKASAESQMMGPFVRGFEVHNRLPKTAMEAGIKSAGSAAPEGTYSELELWKNGVEFLLGMQAENGSFTDCDYDFGGTDSLPNVHVAVTSLAAMAMLRAVDRDDVPKDLKVRLVDSIGRAVEFVANDDHIAKSDRDEILWAYAYRLRLFSRCMAMENLVLKMDREDLKLKIAHATKALENVQSKRGGWYHEYNNPFVTATALIALWEARLAGAVVDDKKIQAGLASLIRDRKLNGSFPYRSREGKGKDQLQGEQQDIAAAAGRMPICELALWQWGKSSDTLLGNAIEQSFDLHHILNSALKYDDHTSNLAYGGFFFWYDMRSRSEAISAVTDKNLKGKFILQQQNLVHALPEIDGCFVDSHELGRVYGTAMALLSLGWDQ